MGRKPRKSAPTTPPAASPSDFIGTAEAAEELGVSQATLRRWVKDGRVEARKVGKQWRIRRSALGSVVAVQTAPSPASPPPHPGIPRQAEWKLDALLAGRGVTPDRLGKVVEDFDSAAAPVEGGDADIRRLMVKLLLNAIEAGADDLHIEPTAGDVRVRQRVDGVLTEVTFLPAEIARPLADEVKRWSKLNLAETRRSQDGRLLWNLDSRTIDIRLNVAPALHGEVVAMRILDRQAALLPLAELGFEPDQLDRWLRLIHARQGLIIVTAPAGSGKTTTIYSTLSELNRPDRKIMTAEDPVEFDIPGIDQMQINPEIGVDFARSVVTMLRQAVDIVFIGEIRDGEVGELLCKAAATGHLVFSTMHANDAPSVPARLMEMGVQPHLIASNLIAVLAQRLVRRVCPGCKSEYRPSEKDLDTLGLQGDDRARTFYHGKGCKQCGMTGYRGRTAVYELLDLDGRVRAAIMNQNAAEIANAGRSSGWRPLRETALDKVFRGETTVEEVLRQT